MTWTPSLDGEIERRLLVNYRVDPDVAARLLPGPFRPLLVGGQAVAGVCLMRLGRLRPHRLPAAVGLRSESAAHRFAVEWDDEGTRRTGVYIPRRDTASALNAVVGGRLFPGGYHRADFAVDETDDDLRVAFEARDGSAAADVRVRVDRGPLRSTLFADTAAASAFFEAGACGWSATGDPHRLDGVGLHTDAWDIEAVVVEHARSSYFDNLVTFPPGSIALDSALVMRHVPVTWRPLGSLRSSPRRREMSPSAS